MFEWRRRLQKADMTDLRHAVLAGLLVVVSTLLCARLVLLQPIRTVDEALFARVVPRLQESRTLVTLSEWLTDMGSKNVAYALIFLLVVYLLAVERAASSAALVVTTLIAAQGLQWLTFASVTGTAPTDFSIGTAGPFYSGGVVRAMIVTGMLVSSVTRRRTPSDTGVVWFWALTVGVIEGWTRLTLGRHWPLDIVAALLIGAGILWCYLAMERWILSWATTATNPMGRPAANNTGRRCCTAPDRTATGPPEPPDERRPTSGEQPKPRDRSRMASGGEGCSSR